jgi:hypothetical protein
MGKQSGGFGKYKYAPAVPLQGTRALTDARARDAHGEDTGGEQKDEKHQGGY